MTSDRFFVMPLFHSSLTPLDHPLLGCQVWKCTATEMIDFGKITQIYLDIGKTTVQTLQAGNFKQSTCSLNGDAGQYFVSLPMNKFTFTRELVDFSTVSPAMLSIGDKVYLERDNGASLNEIDQIMSIECSWEPVLTYNVSFRNVAFEINGSLATGRTVTKSRRTFESYLRTCDTKYDDSARVLVYSTKASVIKTPTVKQHVSVFDVEQYMARVPITTKLSDYIAGASSWFVESYRNA